MSKIDLTKKESIRVGVDFPMALLSMSSQQVQDYVVEPCVDWVMARMGEQRAKYPLAGTQERAAGSSFKVGFAPVEGNDPAAVIAALRALRNAFEAAFDAKGVHCTGSNVGIGKVVEEQRGAFEEEGFAIPDDLTEFNMLVVHVCEFNEGEYSPTTKDEEGDLLINHILAEAGGSRPNPLAALFG